MIYSVLANLILILHLCYIIFVVFGGLLLVYKRWLWKIHLPAVVWGILVQYFVWICPLTTWENYFRDMSGEAGYEDGFVNYFLTSILYPDVGIGLHILLAVGLLLINFAVYYCVFVTRAE